jgi:hypothetical protein
MSERKLNRMPRHRTRGRATGLVGAALVLALATACSGGSHPDASPSARITVPGLISSTAAVPVPFLDRAEQVCVTAARPLATRGPAPTLGAHPSATQLRAYADYLDIGVRARTSAARALAGLGSPTAGGDRWTAFLSAVDADVAAATQQARAADGGDSSGFLTGGRRVLALREQVLQTAAAAGLGPGTVCSRMF